MKLFSNISFSSSMNFNIQKYKEDLLEKGLSYFSLAIPLGLLISILRSTETGWQNIYIIHIFLSLCLILTSIFKKKISYRVKAVIFLGTWLLLGVLGLLSFGLLGGGLMILIIFSLFSSLIFGLKGGIISAATSAFVVISTGFLVSSGRVNLPIDSGIYATSFTSWVVQIATFFLFIPVIIIAIGLIYHYLKVSLDNYRNLVNNIQDTFLYRQDVDGTMIYVSSSFTSILGYTEKEFLGPYRNFLTDHPVNKKVVEFTIKGLHGETQKPYELQALHKNGTKKWLQISERPLFSSTGTVLGIEGIAHDITERKNREIAVNNLLMAVSNTPEHKFLDSMIRKLAESLDCDFAFIGMISKENDHIVNIVSLYTKGLLIEDRSFVLDQTPCYDVVTQGSCLYSRNIQKLFPNDPLLQDMEIEGYAGAPIKDSNNKTTGVMAVLSKTPFSDISFTNSILHMYSERTTIELIKQETESQRIILEEYLLNIINSMPSILIGVDKNLGINQWNKEAETSSGKTADMVSGKNPGSVFPELNEYIPDVQEAIDQNRAIVKRRVDFCINNQKRYVNILVYPLSRKTSSGAVIRIDNVTEQVKTEEMLIQNEKIISLGGLAGGMAHEIKNPLSGIFQSADLLKKRLLGIEQLSTNKKLAEELGIDLELLSQYFEKRHIPQYIDSILESGQRVKDIITNMLNYSRNSSFTQSPCDMAKIMDETLDITNTSFETGTKYHLKNIAVIKEYEKKLPTVICEKNRIQQVFLNILRNGVQAMEEAQVINPRFKLQIYANPDKNVMCIIIEDNGPGMNSEVASRIFEPFFTTKNKESGTGLGLSVSYFIITENYGGNIKVETEPGKGTSFIIELPL